MVDRLAAQRTVIPVLKIIEEVEEARVRNHASDQLVCVPVPQIKKTRLWE